MEDSDCLKRVTAALELCKKHNEYGKSLAVRRAANSVDLVEISKLMEDCIEYAVVRDKYAYELGMLWKDILLIVESEAR